MKFIEPNDKDERAPPLVAKFDSHPHPFRYGVSICDEPECRCREVTYEFTEEPDTSMPSPSPLTFSVVLDLDTWQVVEKEPLEDRAEALASELVRDLGKVDKTLVRHLWATSKAVMDDRETVLTRAEILQGMLVSWPEIAKDHDLSVMRFEHDGEAHFVLDRYCPDPKCDCSKTELSFCLLNPAREKSEEKFTATLQFDGALKIDEVYTCAALEAERVIRSWQECYPRFTGVSRKRYECVKERCADMIRSEGEATNRRITKPEPRPNDRCPCGSGKKYKKCCGR